MSVFRGQSLDQPSHRSAVEPEFVLMHLRHGGCEILSGVRSNEHDDIRERAAVWLGSAVDARELGGDNGGPGLRDQCALVRSAPRFVTDQE
jgi:hypothetical protein